MPRTPLAAVVCIAGLVAGCGSGSKTTTTSKSASGPHKTAAATSAPGIASLAQAPLTLGPPPSGARYDAVNHAFLQRLATLVGHAVERQGLHNVNVTCTASVADRATCKVSGIRGADSTRSATLEIGINRTTGRVTIAVK